MTAHLRGVTLPTDADVDVEIKIHTRLNISAYVAKQKANVCLVLYCGQSFCVDEPALITASATLVLFSLPSGTPWWTEGSRRYLNGCPNRGTP